MNLIPDPARLSRLSVRRRFERNPLRRPADVRYTPPGDTYLVATTLPAPLAVAGCLRPGNYEWFRDGAALLARPAGTDEKPKTVDQTAVADALREALAAMPERPDARDAYNALRAVSGARRCDARPQYLRRVVRAFRQACPPVPRAPRPPRKTDYEYVQTYRARRRADATETARCWLGVELAYPADERMLTEGATVPLADLHRDVADLFFDGGGSEEPLPSSGRMPAMPGPRILDAVLREALGERARVRIAAGIAYRPDAEALASAREYVADVLGAWDTL